MFHWRRPADMPQEEPSEEAIWAAIEAYDPQGKEEMKYRLEQHQDMLAERDLFRGFFVRSPLMPRIPNDLLKFEDPTEWVKNIELKCGEYDSVENTVNAISWGHCDVLWPASDATPPKLQSRLLSHRQALSNSLEWPRDSRVGRIPSPPRGYVAWARYVLQRHKETLKKAGIYGAVYASMFDYKNLPPSWARGVSEFWDPETNTCYIGSEEFTITLWELQAVSGLPVLGYRYEECVPQDDELFVRKISQDGNRRGELILPEVYPRILRHYQRTHERERLPMRLRTIMEVETWTRSFLRKDALTYATASLKDPFRLGLQVEEELTKETAEPDWTTNTPNPILHGISEDLALAGFLVTWLCTFVLPVKENTVRPETLLAASRLAQGQRVSLAPVVLAKICRILFVISRANVSKMKEITLPWQYVQGWVHLHVKGAFTCVGYPPYFQEKGYPSVIQLSNASATLERERIRMFFFAPHLAVGKYELTHQPSIIGLPSDLLKKDVVDAVDSRRQCALLNETRTLIVAEYLFSIRPSWLCHRHNDKILLEGYQPNRVARQFGYSQATAHDGRPPIPGIADVRNLKKVLLEDCLLAAATSWAHLLRLGTGASFRIAAPNSISGVSFTYLTGVRIAFSSMLELGLRKNERKVKMLGVRGKQKPRRVISNTSPIRQEEPVAAAASTSTRVRSRESAPELNGEPISSGKRTCHRQGESRQISVEQPLRSEENPCRDQEEIQPARGQGQEEAQPEPRISTPSEYEDVSEEAEKNMSLTGEGESLVESSAADNSMTCGGHNPAQFEEVSETGLAKEEPAEQVNTMAEPPCEDVPEPAGEGQEGSKEVFESRILSHRENTEEDPQDRAVRKSTIQRLKDLILDISPGDPNSYNCFVTKANATLKFLAHLGLEMKKMEFWEDLCKQAESFIHLMRSFSIVRNQISHSYLKTQVQRRQYAADELYRQVIENTGALKYYQGEKEKLTIECERYTSRIKELRDEMELLMSRRTKIQNDLIGLEQRIETEQYVHQEHQQALNAANEAASKAKEDLQAADDEFEAAAPVLIELHKFQVCVNSITDF